MQSPIGEPVGVSLLLTSETGGGMQDNRFWDLAKE